MDRNAKIGAGIAAGTAAFAAGLVIAFAAPAANSLTSVSEVAAASDDSTASAAPSQGQGRGYGHGVNQLDEATTAKVKAAAESAVEGGTFRTARADGTGYSALVSKADGTMMVVKMDADFQVSTVDEFTGGRGMGGGNGETPLTGADAEKATAAAKAAVEGGTVLRVETDSDGTYEAHVRKADGTEVEVKMDADFKVTSIEEHAGGMGRGGMGGGNGETPLTGADAEKATAAAKAAVEGGTVLRVETDSDGTYEAHVRKADGTEVEVKMDADFKVTSIEEHAGGMGGRGGRHGGGFGPGHQAAPSASASASA